MEFIIQLAPLPFPDFTLISRRWSINMSWSHLLILKLRIRNRFKLVLDHFYRNHIQWHIVSIKYKVYGGGFELSAPFMLNPTLEKCVYNTFTDVVRYICHETFGFVTLLLALSFGDRSCVSKKGRTGGGGWIHFQAEKISPCLVYKNSLGWHWAAGPFSPLLHNGLRK